MHFNVAAILAIVAGASAMPGLAPRFKTCDPLACGAAIGPGAAACIGLAREGDIFNAINCVGNLLGGIVSAPSACAGCTDGPHLCQASGGQCPPAGSDYNACLDFCANNGQDLNSCPTFCEGTCGC